MIPPCTLTTRGDLPNWCERHQKHHNGRQREYALDPGETGAKFRAAWDKMRRCIHLAPARVANHEVPYGGDLYHTALALGTAPRGCRGNTAMQRCDAGHGINGYTVAVTHCTRCPHYTAPVPDSLSEEK